MKVLNAFSPTMLPQGGVVDFRDLSQDEARKRVADGGSVESAVGHPGTAEVFSAILEIAIPANRVQVTLEVGEVALLGSLNGRLPEGKVLTASELAGVQIRWLLVERIG